MQPNRMERHNTTGWVSFFRRRPLVASAGLLGGAFLGSSCASSDEALYTVPYRTAAPERPDSSTPGTGGETGTGGGPGSGGAPGACDVAFCPDQGFGPPCCTDTNQCGALVGTSCIPFPEDAGGGALGTSTLALTPIACRSDSDCGGSQVCCGLRKEGTYSTVDCRATCDETSTFVECSNGEHCGAGQVCCGMRAEGQSYYSRLSCQSECEGFVLCRSNEDCSGNTTCLASVYLPEGFTVCR